MAFACIAQLGTGRLRAATGFTLNGAYEDVSLCLNRIAPAGISREIHEGAGGDPERSLNEATLDRSIPLPGEA